MDSLRPLGRTAIRVSPVGLGTVKLGRDQGVKYAAPFTLPDDDQAARLLGAAAELGVNLIDTAPAYGTSEERLGALMAKHDWFGGRQRWVVCTKVGEEFENGASVFDFSPQAVLTSVQRSLYRLGVSELDIVLIHSDGDDETILKDSGAFEILVELRRSGEIRAIGISSKTVAGGLLGVQLGLDVVMVTLNAQDSSQLPVIQAAAQAGAGVLIKKGLAAGHAAVAPGASPVGEAMSFIFKSGGAGVSSVVVGTLNPAHLRQNVDAARAALKALPTPKA